MKSPFGRSEEPSARALYRQFNEILGERDIVEVSAVGAPLDFYDGPALDPQFIAQRDTVDDQGTFIKITVREGRTPEECTLAVLPTPKKRTGHVFRPSESSPHSMEEAKPKDRADLGRIAKIMRSHQKQKGTD